MLFIVLFYRLNRIPTSVDTLSEIFHELVLETDFQEAIKTSVLRLSGKKCHMWFYFTLYLKLFCTICSHLYLYQCICQKRINSSLIIPQMSVSRRLSYIWLSVFLLETRHKWLPAVLGRLWSSSSSGQALWHKPLSFMSRVRVFITWIQMPKTRRLRISVDSIEYCCAFKEQEGVLCQIFEVSTLLPIPGSYSGAISLAQKTYIAYTHMWINWNSAH